MMYGVTTSRDRGHPRCEVGSRLDFKSGLGGFWYIRHGDGVEADARGDRSESCHHDACAVGTTAALATDGIHCGSEERSAHYGAADSTVPPLWWVDGDHHHYGSGGSIVEDLYPVFDGTYAAVLYLSDISGDYAVCTLRRGALGSAGTIRDPGIGESARVTCRDNDGGGHEGVGSKYASAFVRVADSGHFRDQDATSDGLYGNYFLYFSHL